jgi:hypothetical protein
MHVYLNQLLYMYLKIFTTKDKVQAPLFFLVFQNLYFCFPVRVVGALGGNEIDTL